MTTRKGNRLVVQKENCVVEEIKEAVGSLAARLPTVISYVFPYLYIPSDMCSPTWETHIPSDMCSPTWKTHIPRDICSLT